MTAQLITRSQSISSQKTFLSCSFSHESPLLNSLLDECVCDQLNQTSSSVSSERVPLQKTVRTKTQVAPVIS